MYDKSSTIIWLHKDADKIRKGCVARGYFSPKLFRGVLESIFWKMNWEGMRVNIKGEYSNNRWFTDNILLISEPLGELQEILNDLNMQSHAVDLKIDSKKQRYILKKIIKIED